MIETSVLKELMYTTKISDKEQIHEEASTNKIFLRFPIRTTRGHVLLGAIHYDIELKSRQGFQGPYYFHQPQTWKDPLLNKTWSHIGNNKKDQISQANQQG